VEWMRSSTSLLDFGKFTTYGGVEASFYVSHSDRVAAAERPPRPVCLTQKLSLKAPRQAALV